MKTVCLGCFERGRYTVKEGACPVCGETRGMLTVSGKKYEVSNIKLWPQDHYEPIDVEIKTEVQ